MVRPMGTSTAIPTVPPVAMAPLQTVTVVDLMEVITAAQVIRWLT